MRAAGLVLLGLGWALGLPSGAPTCENRPPHGRLRTDPSPFALSFDRPCYTAATSVAIVTLSGGTGFHGFVVEAPAGEFAGTGDDFRANCGRFSITHSHHSRKTAVAAPWTPPKASQEPMLFTATVFRSYVDGSRTGSGEFWDSRATTATLFHCDRINATWRTRRPEPPTPRPPRVVVWTTGPHDTWTGHWRPPTTPPPRPTSTRRWRFWTTTDRPTTAAFPLSKMDECESEINSNKACSSFVGNRAERCRVEGSYEANFCRYSCCLHGFRLLPIVFNFEGLRTTRPPPPLPEDRPPSGSGRAMSESCELETDGRSECAKWVSARPGNCRLGSDAFETRFCRASCCRLAMRSAAMPRDSPCSSSTDAEWDCGEWVRAESRPCSAPQSFESMRCRRSCCLLRSASSPSALPQTLPDLPALPHVSPRGPSPSSAGPDPRDPCGGLWDVQDACTYWVEAGVDNCASSASYVAQLCQRACCRHKSAKRGPPPVRPYAELQSVGRDRCVGLWDESDLCQGWVALHPDNCRIVKAHEFDHCRLACCQLSGARYGPLTTTAPLPFDFQALGPESDCAAQRDAVEDCGIWVHRYASDCRTHDSWLSHNCAGSCCDALHSPARSSRVRFSDVGVRSCGELEDKDGECESFVRLYPGACAKPSSYEHKYCRRECCRQARRR